MKKWLASIFLFIFLSANTAFGQLLKLPILVHHYLEHVSWDNSTILEFIAEHYSDHINHPDDQHGDHKNLPFKTLDSSTTSIVALMPQSALVLQYVKTIIVVKKAILYNHEHVSQAHLNAIWQPPRLS